MFVIAFDSRNRHDNHQSCSGSVATAIIAAIIMAITTARLRQQRNHFTSIVLNVNAAIYKTCLLIFFRLSAYLSLPASALPIHIFFTFTCYSCNCFCCFYICTQLYFFQSHRGTLVRLPHHTYTHINSDFSFVRVFPCLLPLKRVSVLLSRVAQQAGSIYYS